MEASGNLGLDARPRLTPAQRRNAGFSLVEVALALGIMSFAFVSIFGLLPLGLNSFRQTMVISTGSQIAQQVLDEAQQSDFDTLIHDSAPTTADPTIPFVKPVRYFDDQGSEVAGGDPSALYWVNTRVLASTSLPGGTTGFNNLDIATVTVQVANNPAHRSMVSVDKLWQASPALSVVTSSTYVARNLVSAPATTP